jgi:hypothetical protein
MCLIGGTNIIIRSGAFYSPNFKGTGTTVTNNIYTNNASICTSNREITDYNRNNPLSQGVISFMRAVDN